MKVYVASRSSNHNLALQEGNVIAVASFVPRPLEGAKLCAYDHTDTTGEPAWVYEVELKAVGSYKAQTEVVFVSTQ